MAVGPINSAQSAAAVGKAGRGPAVPSQNFVRLLERAVASVNRTQLEADNATRQLVAGQADSLHEVVLAVTKAELSFRLFIEVRNRLIEAYQEVMRMQV